MSLILQMKKIESFIFVQCAHGRTYLYQKHQMLHKMRSHCVTCTDNPVLCSVRYIPKGQHEIIQLSQKHDQKKQAWNWKIKNLNPIDLWKHFIHTSINDNTRNIFLCEILKILVAGRTWQIQLNYIFSCCAVGQYPACTA